MVQWSPFLSDQHNTILPTTACLAVFQNGHAKPHFLLYACVHVAAIYQGFSFTTVTTSMVTIASQTHALFRERCTMRRRRAPAAKGLTPRWNPERIEEVASFSVRQRKATWERTLRSGLLL